MEAAELGPPLFVLLPPTQQRGLGGHGARRYHGDLRKVREEKRTEGHGGEEGGGGFRR